jgi:intein-encoded DNA endonuclease-like protein
LKLCYLTIKKLRKDLKQLRRTDLWDNIDKIITLYKSGKNYTEIGKMYNTSDVQIKLMLKKKQIL